MTQVPPTLILLAGTQLHDHTSFARETGKCSPAVSEDEADGGFSAQPARCHDQLFRSAKLWLSLKASLMAQLVKNMPAMQETPIQFLGWEDLLEKG